MGLLTISAKRLYDLCPRRFSYRYLREIEPAQSSKALERGTAFHEDAEAAHTTGGDEAYAQWVKQHEQFDTESAEIPFALPFQDLLEHSLKGSVPPSQEFGGVVDLVGRRKSNGDLWIIDHKSVERFYTYPDIYATEQLYLYLSSYQALKKVKVAGVCLSRVKVKTKMNPKHFDNYVVKYLKENLDNEITLTKLRQLSKKIKGAVQVLSTYISTLKAFKEPLKEVHTHRDNKGLRIVLKGKHLKGINTYVQPDAGDSNAPSGRVRPAGLLESSIWLYGDTMIHVERRYFIPQPQELQQVAVDYAKFLQNLERSKGEHRRATGVHCAQCPFRIPCEASRRGEAEFYPTPPTHKQGEGAVTPPGAFYDAEGNVFTITPPNQEIKKATDRKTILQYI